MHPRFLFRRACQLVLPPTQVPASFLGAALGRGGTGLGTQGRAPKSSRRACLPRSQRPSENKDPARGMPGVGKPHHPFLHLRPQLLCICLFTLEKAPRPRQEMGQFQQAEQGNKEPHCVPCLSSPPWASHRSLGTGGSMGARAGRRRGPELPAFRASPVKGLLCGEGRRAARMMIPLGRDRG